MDCARTLKVTKNSGRYKIFVIVATDGCEQHPAIDSTVIKGGVSEQMPYSRKDDAPNLDRCILGVVRVGHMLSLINCRGFLPEQLSNLDILWMIVGALGFCTVVYLRGPREVHPRGDAENTVVRFK